MLKTFLQEVGTALNTVTKLGLHLTHKSGSYITLRELSLELERLVDACPAVNSLEFEGHMPLTLLHRVAKVCPLLYNLTLSNNDRNCDYLQTVLKDLPSLLPNVSSLTLILLPDVLPDMSCNTGILSLVWHDQVCGDEICWTHFPPNLQTLTCGEFLAAPVVRAGTSSPLGSLLCLDIICCDIRLPVLVQLLHAAPALQQLKMEQWCVRLDGPILNFGTVNVSLDAFTAANLQVLSEKFHVLGRPVFKIICNSEEIEGWEAFFSAFPCMAGVKHCRFDEVAYDQFAPLLKFFPNVQVLSLKPVEGFDGEDLQELDVCAHLTHLCLLSDVDVDQMQLLEVCLSVPTLKRISHCACDDLGGPALEEFNKLLESHSLYVEVIDIGEDPD